LCQKRRGKWVIDYRDQFGKRYWETAGTSRKEAEEKLAGTLLEIREGINEPGFAKLPLVALCLGLVCDLERRSRFNGVTWTLRAASST
jgi:hypothetical protein